MNAWTIAVAATLAVTVCITVPTVTFVMMDHQTVGNEQNEESISFNQGTFELFRSAGIGRSLHLRNVLFNKDEGYLETGFNGETTGYEFPLGDSTGVCAHVGDHDNCFVISKAFPSLSVTIPKIPKGAKSVDCPLIKNPVFGGKKRELTECYLFHEPDEGGELDLWVEFKTNYPVKMVFTGKNGGSYIVDWCSFETEKPSDRTKLKPIQGVPFYDFRNGKEGIYTETKKTKATRHSTMKTQTTKQSHMGMRVFFDTMLSQSMMFSSMGPAPIQKMSARDTIPESFDARQQWPKCSVINKISDQDPCDSCWAMASSAVLSDRVCIATDGSVDVSLSPQFMINCFSDPGGPGGCNGQGNGAQAMKGLMTVGTVPESCIKYSGPEFLCTGTCNDGSLVPKTTKAKNIYSPWGNTDTLRVQAIQREIMEHGPVVASFYLFSDFGACMETNDVYHRSKNAELLGGHVVHIIGWGSENGKDYWLVANSYGTDFPEKGFFKISRGNNECNIEENVAAGEPLI